MRRRAAVTFVVMAGGRGERLWPLVRLARPKVCISADGTRSLLRATIDRLRPVWPGAAWLVVTIEEQAKAVRADLPAGLRRSLLVEPQPRNTAACLTLAAMAVAKRDPGRIMVAVPADHWVGDVTAFRRSVRAAIAAARAQDEIVTIGIRPTAAHPGLGYLCAGAPVRVRGSARTFRLDRFVEKPSRAKARKLLARPRTYWNSGIFVATAETFLERVTEWLPEHTRRLVRVSPRVGAVSVSRPVRRAYRALAAISFDHGVMNHLRRGVVVEGRFAWADLGSWDAWSRHSPNGSRLLAVDSRRVMAVSQEPHLIAVLGVQDLLIVHTPSATLICPAAKAQAVREVVARLSQHPELAVYR